MATAIPTASLSPRTQPRQYLGKAIWHLMIGNPALGFYNPTPGDREAVKIILERKGELS
jgi:hypothetical protein